MFLELSYLISPDTTVLDPSLKTPCVVPRGRILDGRSCNTSYIEIYAHAGTHIDAPWHFNQQSPAMLDFEVSDFVFSQVSLLDIAKDAYEPVTYEDVSVHDELIDRLDCLLIRTGFGSVRRSDPTLYLHGIPGLSLEAAQFLAGFSGLRCIGVDFYSIENLHLARMTGFPVHHTLLDRPEPMILLEDANLDAAQDKKIERLYLFPLRMAGLEASPVTAVAETDG